MNQEQTDYAIQANDFIMRQEVRTLQHMSDSKTRQIQYLEKELRERSEQLKDMYELWKEIAHEHR